MGITVVTNGLRAKFAVAPTSNTTVLSISFSLRIFRLIFHLDSKLLSLSEILHLFSMTSPEIEYKFMEVSVIFSTRKFIGKTCYPAQFWINTSIFDFLNLFTDYAHAKRPWRKKWEGFSVYLLLRP